MKKKQIYVKLNLKMLKLMIIAAKHKQTVKRNEIRKKNITLRKNKQLTHIRKINIEVTSDLSRRKNHLQLQKLSIVNLCSD